MGGLARAAYCQTHGHQAIATAAVELFWARSAAHLGCLAPARRLSGRAFPGGTLAQRTGPAQETQRERQREEEKESGAEATLATVSSSFQGGFMKNLPVKAPLPPLLEPSASPTEGDVDNHDRDANHAESC